MVSGLVAASAVTVAASEVATCAGADAFDCAFACVASSTKDTSTLPSARILACSTALVMRERDDSFNTTRSMITSIKCFTFLFSVRGVPSYLIMVPSTRKRMKPSRDKSANSLVNSPFFPCTSGAIISARRAPDVLAPCPEAAPVSHTPEAPSTSAPVPEAPSPAAPSHPLLVSAAACKMLSVTWSAVCWVITLPHSGQ